MVAHPHAAARDLPDIRIITDHLLQGCCHSAERDDNGPPHPTPLHQRNTDSATRVRTPPRTGPSTSDVPSLPRYQSTRSGPRNGVPMAPSETLNRPLTAVNPYRSKRLRNRKSLDRQREEFFHTAITGRREIWDVLRTVTELLRSGDVATAQGILDAAGVTLPDGDLVSGGAYDETGNFYQLPKEVVGDPENIADSPNPPEVASEHPKETSQTDGEEDSADDEDDPVNQKLRSEEKGKGILNPQDTIKVKSRLSDRGGPSADIVVKIGKQQSVKTLAKLIEEEAGLTGKAKIRLAYLGKILDEIKPLEAQGWKPEYVLNALVAPLS